MTPRLSTALQQRWSALSQRERWGLGSVVALLLVGTALSGVVAPAWRTLQRSPEQLAVLQKQLGLMQQMQARVQTVQNQTRLSTSESGRILQSQVQSLGTLASISINGDNATVTLRGLSADALAQWLALARTQAQALPTQVQLKRAAAQAATNVALAATNSAPAATPNPTSKGPSSSPQAVHWDGQVVLQLPPKVAR